MRKNDPEVLRNPRRKFKLCQVEKRRYKITYYQVNSCSILVVKKSVNEILGQFFYSQCCVFKYGFTVDNIKTTLYESII